MRVLEPIAVVVIVGLAGCTDAQPPGDDTEGPAGSESGGTASETEATDDSTTDAEDIEDSSTGEPGPPDACADACIDTASGAGAALCHSCRCKVAFDDWLPSVEQLQCGNAETIVTYHADASDEGHELVPAPFGAIRCANPSLLTGSCRQGSKLGHITHGDVSVYWVCRDTYLDFDGSVMYEDMAIVGHNARTGATCFWDDIDHVMHDDDVPPLDLQEASEQERERAIELLPYHDGSTCVTCHDHDPFIYTPYLESTGWQSIAASKGPYHLVTLDGTPRPTGVEHLVSPAASACTGCHRLGSENTCSYFAPDSLGALKINAHEQEVHDAMDPSNPLWALARWMPGDTGEHAIADFFDWEDAYGDARDHVLACCEAPGVNANGCEWAPVPAQ